MLGTNAHAPELLVIDEDRMLLTYGACDYTGGYVTRYVMAMLGDARRDFEGAEEKIIYTGIGKGPRGLWYHTLRCSCYCKSRVIK